MLARETPTSNVSLSLDRAGWHKIVDPVIGMRIRGLREQAGAEIGETARLLGLRVTALKAIENGEEPTDSALLHCLASIFRVSVAFFFDGLPAVANAAVKPDPAAQPRQAPRAGELVKIINIYASLPDKQLRKSLMELIESVVQAKP